MRHLLLCYGLGYRRGGGVLVESKWFVDLFSPKFGCVYKRPRWKEEKREKEGKSRG